MSRLYHDGKIRPSTSPLVAYKTLGMICVSCLMLLHCGFLYEGLMFLERLISVPLPTLLTELAVPKVHFESVLHRGTSKPF